MQSGYHIAVLPGDGIGKEVMQSAADVLAAVAARTGATCQLDYRPAGAQHYLDNGVALPEPTLRACERADTILFGAMGLPHVRGTDGTEIPNLAIVLYTPPVGGTLFVAAKLAKVGIGEITKHLWPLMTATFSIVLLVTYIPQLSTWFPRLIQSL